LVIVFSTLGDTAHVRQLATQPARLCFELNFSGTNPLMVNESKPRSTPTPPREEDEIWGCPLMFLKKFGGCDCTVCIAGGVAQACLGTAPSGTGVRTYECGACENLLTVLDMIFTCERWADFLWRRCGLHRSPLCDEWLTVTIRKPEAYLCLARGLGRARSWLLLCCRLSWRAEGVSLPASPGGHLHWRSWRAEPASLLAQCGCGVS